MKVKPNEILHIGDTLKSDYYMPKKYGWNVLYYGKCDEVDVKSIEFLTDLINILNIFTKTIVYATATINNPIILAFGLNPFVFFNTNFLKSSIKPINPNPTATPINGKSAVATSI